MKKADISSILVEPSPREEINGSLRSDETLALAAESSERLEMAHRRYQAGFVRRGLASIARSEANGDWVTAEQVIAKLEAKLAAARERRMQRGK